MVDPPYRTKNMMPGMIMLWRGSIATIPSGWHVCDGTMGTPNLEHKFVKGAGTIMDPGTEGGHTTHAHDFTADDHDHGIPEGDYIEAGDHFADTTESEVATGTTESVSHEPPFYALCYIMKL